MDSTKALTLATSRMFNGNHFDCYVEETDKDTGDFWATREQIGRLLEYVEPMKSIAKIHERNSERLDKFSTVVNLTTVEGNRMVTREVIVYNFKGLLEICRYSNQPKANAVMDFLWDIADEIRKTGAYSINGDIQNHIRKLEAENKLLHEKVDSMLEQLEADRSFAALGKVVTLQNGVVSFSEAGKLLAQLGIKIGPNGLMKKAREKNILCKCKGRRYNQPTQKAIKNGLAVLGISFGYKGTPYLTAKGLQFFSDEYVGQFFPLLALIEGGEAVNA